MKKRIVIPWILPLLFVGTIKAQWTDISAPTNKSLTHAAFTDETRGYVSSSTYNTLWRTVDGGVSWDSTVFIETVYDIDFSNDMNDK